MDKQIERTDEERIIDKRIALMILKRGVRKLRDYAIQQRYIAEAKAESGS